MNTSSNPVQHSEDYRWLERLKRFIPACSESVLELGCCYGEDTQILAEWGFNVVTSDLEIKEEQKQRFKVLANINIIQLNHQHPLPFKKDIFDVVLASLCLHYFDRTTTLAIFAEIYRVIKKNGVLLCRLNAMTDINFGAGTIPLHMQENDIAFNQEQKKAFFSPAFVNTVCVMHPWILLHSASTTIDRYNVPKEVIEFVLKK